MKNRLLWKLLGINIPVIATVILVVWLAIDILAANYFSELMEKYHIAPVESHGMFVESIRRYLIQGSVIALGLSVVLSYFLTRAVLRPLLRISEITERLASGNYSARTGIATDDEIGRLGRAFDQMADNLEKIEHLRKTMIVDIAHELRTPLTNIRGYLEGLSDGVVSPSRETFEMLEQEILRLVRLVNDLQQLTRADAAGAFLNREEVHLPELVDQVLDLYRFDFQSRNISVGKKFSDEARCVKADRDKLMQALSNLIQNASKYTPIGGAIEISADVVADGIMLAFANTGGGIAEEELPFIFERFYRADKSRSRESGGAGLGLAIVKSLIEAHGGSVGAACDRDKIRIWLTLPA
ncbi:MAG: ATP-binding protein [bacterium]|nr:ATP-binding protein [bacterium]